jgi:ParB family chromosome partitioning protein
LEALLPNAVTPKQNPDPTSDVQELRIDHIIPNRYQPRKTFSEEELSQLAESIKENGLIQPILVRRRGDGIFELIAGERRLRAARLAGLTSIRAIIRNSSDEQAMELALVENLQRQDLNPIEAARAYQRLITEFGFTQDGVAQRIGKDRSSVANIARLLNLPTEIQQLIESGALTTGHAKVLLGLPGLEPQVRLARQIMERHLSVRQAEQLASQGTHRPQQPVKRAQPASDLEERLQKRLGTKVSIQNGRRGGKIVLHFFGRTELDRLVELLLD